LDNLPFITASLYLNKINTTLLSAGKKPWATPLLPSFKIHHSDKRSEPSEPFKASCLPNSQLENRTVHCSENLLRKSAGEVIGNIEEKALNWAPWI